MPTVELATSADTICAFHSSWRDDASLMGTGRGYPETMLTTSVEKFAATSTRYSPSVDGALNQTGHQANESGAESLLDRFLLRISRRVLWRFAVGTPIKSVS